MGDSNNGQASTSQANDLKTVTTSLQALTEQVGRLQTFMNYLMSDSEEQDTQPSSPIPSTSGITPPQNTTLESSDSEPVIIAGGSGATDNGESESEKEPTSLFRELLDKYDTKEKCGPALDTDLAELINTMMTHQQSPESIKTILRTLSQNPSFISITFLPLYFGTLSMSKTRAKPGSPASFKVFPEKIKHSKNNYRIDW